MLKSGVMLADRYEIVGRIGSGGMADVYKALDHKLNRNVAVKVMKPEFQSDSTFISKFRREAQAAAGLANPNIVNVYDVGEDEGSYYIVMELVEGITLKEYIAKKGRLSVREATSIAIQVAMGLSAAHDQGIVHRDVKPQNIIISTDGKVKVTDFGIARAASSNTISANAMGSVHYSSPEQVRGGYSDARSDIYSLGISLYEMITGRVPFDGETTVAIAIKHLQDEMEPPSHFVSDLPYSLEQIIYKCTQKGVDRRYQNMSEVITDLKRSLMEPDGDFVEIAPLADQAATVAISPAEQAAIRAAGRTGTARQETVPAGGGTPPAYSSIENAKKGVETSYDEDPEDEYEEDEDSNPGLEKALTIGSFVLCGLIIAILLFFILQAVGILGKKKDADADTQTQTQTQTAAPAAAGTDAESSADNAEGIEVPPLVGMTEDEAKETATQKGLDVRLLGEKGSDQPQGNIIEQEPAAGTYVAKNSTISYYISSGPETTAIPAVVNLPSADAESALQAAGFTNIRTENANSETVARGSVISVTPAEGEMAMSSAEIVLTVSTGPENAPDVSVPNYRGQTGDYAKEDAESLGLIVSFNYGSVDDLNEGDVMGQSIEGGSEVPAGSELILTINDAEKAAEQGPETAGTDAETTAAPTPAPTQVAGQTESGAETPDAAQSTDAAAAGAQTGTEQTADAAGWTTAANLGAAPNYNGGAYRLILVQTVNGEEVRTTVEESESALTFPHLLNLTGAAGVSDGLVQLEERQESGEYTPLVQWPVTFAAGN